MCLYLPDYLQEFCRKFVLKILFIFRSDCPTWDLKPNPDCCRSFFMGFVCSFNLIIINPNFFAEDSLSLVITNLVVHFKGSSVKTDFCLKVVEN